MKLALADTLEVLLAEDVRDDVTEADAVPDSDAPSGAAVPVSVDVPAPDGETPAAGVPDAVNVRATRPHVGCRKALPVAVIDGVGVPVDVRVTVRVEAELAVTLTLPVRVPV